MKKKAVDLCLSDLLIDENESIVRIFRLEKGRFKDAWVSVFVYSDTGYFVGIHELKLDPDKEVLVVDK